MSVNAAELVNKLTYVLSSRRLKEKEYIQEYLPIPTSHVEEEDTIKELLFVFLKKKFPGCKIRVNANSFSLRLDGHIHRKANKIREIHLNDPEWKQFFEQNHDRLNRIMRNHRKSFDNTSLVERRIVDDKIFLYIPFRTNRVYGYANYGIQEFCKWLEDEYLHDVALAEIYEEVTQIIKVEVERRERERIERIERELSQYMSTVRSSVFKPVAPLQESEEAIDRLFASKFIAWARENNKVPEFAVPVGVQELVPSGLKVKIKAPAGSEEEGWVALPPFEGYQEPEHLELQGWGKVTSIDTTSDRSRNGRAPIIVQEYLYLEFNLDYWKHLIPEGYDEILEVTNRLRAEAQAEIAPWLEQERIRQEAEEARRLAEEAERLQAIEAERLRVEEQIRRRVEEEQAQQLAANAEEEAQRRVREERRAQLADQLRAQLTEQPTVADLPSVPDVDVDFVPEPASPEPERAVASGLYRNAIAIPLERYVAINGEGQSRRFREVRSAIEWLDLPAGTVQIHDYHAPHAVVDTYVID